MTCGFSIELVRQLTDKRDALRACVLYSGKKLKAIGYGLGIDAGHLSKMLNPGQDPRHFPPEKENLLMDVCGNEIPLLWALLSRGYELPSTVQELRQENKVLKEQLERALTEVAQLRQEQRYTFNVFKNLEVT